MRGTSVEKHHDQTMYVSKKEMSGRGWKGSYRQKLPACLGRKEKWRIRLDSAATREEGRNEGGWKSRLSERGLRGRAILQKQKNKTRGRLSGEVIHYGITTNDPFKKRT